MIFKFSEKKLKQNLKLFFIVLMPTEYEMMLFSLRSFRTVVGRVVLVVAEVIVLILVTVP